MTAKRKARRTDYAERLIRAPQSRVYAAFVDADTLDIHSQRIRLVGVDAPESKQKCLDAGGTLYRCGADAANALDQWINRNPVTPGTIVPPDGLPSDQRRLVRVKTIWGDIAPKSIVNNGAGLFFAQNMMYRHSITVYDRSFRLVATISDAVRLADFGLAGPDYTLLGAPVEAAATSDGSKMWSPDFNVL